MLGLLGWERCDFATYREACATFGFNAESDPDFLHFQMDRGAAFTFAAYAPRGTLQGAACIDHGWLASDKKNPKRVEPHLPIPADAVCVPMAPGVRCIAPFKAKCLHALNAPFVNSAFQRLSGREICLAKSPEHGFSKKTVSTREREVRRLLEDGGSLRDFSEFDPETLLDIYRELYLARRDEYPPNRDGYLAFFRRFHARLLGDVLFYQGAPCAMQLNVQTLSAHGLFVDYINMGLRQDIETHSFGTLLIWNNIKKAQALADRHQATLRYSFGNPSAPYKDRWCYREKVGKLFYL